jgi:hypothetical protein
MTLWRRHPVTDRPVTCREVGRFLQRYLDGVTDGHVTARVAEHLEDCRRCGLEAEIYRDIKASLARQTPILPEATLACLRRFGDQLAAAPGPPEISPATATITRTDRAPGVTHRSGRGFAEAPGMRCEATGSLSARCREVWS